MGMKQFWPTALFLATGAAAAVKIPNSTAAMAFLDQAISAYNRNDFAAARDAYETLAQEGWGDAALYADLGNAYSRLGAAGRARLWYERALALEPRNEDARYNRDLLLERLGLKEDSSPPLAPWTEDLSWTFALLNALFFAALGWRFLKGPNEVAWWAACGTGLALLAAGTLAGIARSQAGEAWSVVTSPRAEARTAPSEEASVGFILPEGQKLALLGSSGDWREVGLTAQGLKGWVKTGDIEPVTLPPARSSSS
jgi:tetratricopeptide (TPR) repeat protein